MDSKHNKLFWIVMSVSGLLSILLVLLSVFDESMSGVHSSIIFLGYPIILFAVAATALASLGQCHRYTCGIDWAKYKWSFAGSMVIFAIFFLPKLISAIFNIDGLYYDDRWEKVASAGAAFIIASWVGIFLNKFLSKK